MRTLQRLLCLSAPFWLYLAVIIGCIRVAQGAGLVGRLLFILVAISAQGSIVLCVYSARAEKRDGLAAAFFRTLGSRVLMPIFRGIATVACAIFRVAVGDRGPEDIVAVVEREGVTFRLPHRWHPVDKTAPWLLVPGFLGLIVVPVTLASTLALPAAQQDLPGMALGLSVILVIMGHIVYKWRLVWREEIHLTSTALQAALRTTFLRTPGANFDHDSMQQFTVLRREKDFVLQAEFNGSEPAHLVGDHDGEMLVRLANRLAQQLAEFDSKRAVIRIAHESLLEGVQTERLHSPVATKVCVTRQATGVAVDFPLRADGRLVHRRTAWRLFEIGVLLLVGSILWFSFCIHFQFREWLGPGVLVFGAGLIVLIVAAHRASKSFTDQCPDEELVQLSVAGNLLIRTTRDHRKEIWFRQEIDALRLEDQVETQVSGSEGDTVTVLYHLRLLLCLRNGDKTLLASWNAGYPLEDYRPKAELEWIATVLRQALLGAAPSSSPDADQLALTHAFKPAGGYSDETRIKL